VWVSVLKDIYCKETTMLQTSPLARILRDSHIPHMCTSRCVRIVLPCPECVIAALLGNWLPSPRLDWSRLRSLFALPVIAATNTRPEATQTLVRRQNSTPTDSRGSRNKSDMQRLGVEPETLGMATRGERYTTEVHKRHSST
jgi:hypothetical protein